jgi:hypothetical protein
MRYIIEAKNTLTNAKKDNKRIAVHCPTNREARRIARFILGKEWKITKIYIEK